MYIWHYCPHPHRCCQWQHHCHRYHHIVCALYIHIGGHKGPSMQSCMKLDLDRHIEHMTIISKIVALVLPDQIESTAIVHVTSTLNMDPGNWRSTLYFVSIQHPQPYFLSHQTPGRRGSTPYISTIWIEIGCIYKVLYSFLGMKIRGL